MSIIYYALYIGVKRKVFIKGINKTQSYFIQAYLVCMLSHFNQVWLFATPWTVAFQAPLSMGFSRQEYWNGLLCPPPGDLPDPGIKPVSLISPDWQVGSLPRVPPGKPKLTLNWSILHDFSHDLSFLEGKISMNTIIVVRVHYTYCLVCNVRGCIVSLGIMEPRVPWQLAIYS